MPESRAEKIRSIARELVRIRNELRQLVDEEERATTQTPGAVPAAIVGADKSGVQPAVPGASSGVAPPRQQLPATVDRSPIASSGDPLEEILGAAALPSDNASSVDDDEDIVVVDISLPAQPHSIGAGGAAPSAEQAGAAAGMGTQPTARGAAASGTQQATQMSTGSASKAPPGAGSDDEALFSGDEKRAKSYPKKPPPRKRASR